MLPPPPAPLSFLPGCRVAILCGLSGSSQAPLLRAPLSHSLRHPCSSPHSTLLPLQLCRKHKVGILYCKAGQSSEEEMYNNEEAGPAFEEFLSLIGEKVCLKGFTKYAAQLDVKSKWPRGPPRGVPVRWPGGSRPRAGMLIVRPLGKTLWHILVKSEGAPTV